jgi:hypothetical protein
MSAQLNAVVKLAANLKRDPIIFWWFFSFVHILSKASVLALYLKPVQAQFEKKALLVTLVLCVLCPFE